MKTKNDKKIIIQIEGKDYDVTNFADKHHGGNVFKNGVDLTKGFIANHKSDFSRLKPFEVKSEVEQEKIVKTVEATQIIDKTDDQIGEPKPYSLKDLDKVLEEELEEL
jgi:cytochrome b involved in lipid metabolism